MKRKLSKAKNDDRVVRFCIPDPDEIKRITNPEYIDKKKLSAANKKNQKALLKFTKTTKKKL